MAKKTESFRIDEKKGTITLYTNVEQTEVEKNLIAIYVSQGYKPLIAEKKKGISVEEMRKELEGTDFLNEFNKAYKKKEGGFHEACRIYNKWKKDNK